MASTIKLKRGQKTNVETAPLQAGEPIVSLDTKEVFVGDGDSAQGFPLGTVKGPASPTSAGQVVLFKDDTGRLLEAQDKDVFLQGLLDNDDLTNITQTITNVDEKFTTALENLPGRISAGTAEPTGGEDGDIYIQYS